MDTYRYSAEGAVCFESESSGRMNTLETISSFRGNDQIVNDCGFVQIPVTHDVYDASRY